MPRGKAKETLAEPTLQDVITALNGLTEVVTKLVDNHKSPVVTEISIQPDLPATPAQPQVTMSNGFPIPFEYQELVNTLLNKKFKVEINYLADQAAFSFEILVPKEYSNASEAHWNTYHEDRRSKVIQNAYGANGVREWVLHVYENFGEETKSAITYDRSNLSNI